LPKLPKLTAKEAQKLLFNAGFLLDRTKGRHYIFVRGSDRMVLPSHAGKTLHPKIVKQVMEAIDREV